MTTKLWQERTLEEKNQWILNGYILIGRIGWKTDGKEIYANIFSDNNIEQTPRKNKKIIRYQTSAMVGIYCMILEIDLDKSLVYFPIFNEEMDFLGFETKGKKINIYQLLN